MFSKIVPGAQREQVFSLLGEQVREWAQVKRRTFVAAWSKGSRERIGVLLREHGVATDTFETWEQARKAKAGPVGLLTLGLERGFVAEDLALVSEQDLLGERIGRPPRRRRRADELIAEASELSAGD